jgi:5-methyltetrahydropteroyltriglutamate--homocysteine methyltransferase
MFVATKDKALQTTTTGALPRPTWYTENLRGQPLSVGFSQRAYREQHFDCLAANIAMQHKAGIDILVDGDCRLDDDWAGRSWVAYPLERIDGIGPGQLEVQPAGFLSADRGPGDIMWEVIETRLTPHVTGPIGATRLELDRAYKAMAGMTDKPCKIGSASAQILTMMVKNEHYEDRAELLFALSDAMNKEYHAVVDAGAPLIQIEEPEVHQTIHDPNAPFKPETWVDAFNREVKGLRDRTEVWAHTCWGSPAGQRVLHADATYERALPYYDQLDIDVLCMEGASNKCAEVPLYGRMISKDKKIAVGILNHRSLQVERPEEVADMIRTCLQHIEPERLILASDCGFGRQAMSRIHAYYKMVSLVRGANIVRKELGLGEVHIPACDPKLSMVPVAEV